jgi:three-Cys-motif partner protein
MHTFGGVWTDAKLDALRRYLQAYNTALQHKPTKDRPFTRLYVDAFAGSGERAARKRASSEPEGFSLFTDQDEVELDAEVKKGSTVIALETSPPFHRYIFIEKNVGRAAELETLRTQFPDRTIAVLPKDANEALCSIAASTEWRGTRALVFIDPYGMQVSWATLEALARTKAVDVALLFPTGPLNRMLKREGDIPESWQRRIDDHLGCTNWRDAFYAQRTTRDLFGDVAEGKKTATIEGLRQFAEKRFAEVFPWVCPDALPLVNSKGSVLYHLFMMCANPAKPAGDLAMRLARSAVKPRNSAR